MKSKDTKIRGVKRCKIEKYIYSERRQVKKYKFRGLKDTNEELSISQETVSKDTKKTPVPELKGTLQDSVKRYKETPVKLHTGEKPRSKVCTEIEKPQSRDKRKTPVLKSKGTKRKAG